MTSDFSEEPQIRLLIFAGVFGLLAIWELVDPRRQQAIGRGVRWPSNIGVAALDTLTVRIFFPTGAVGLAMLVGSKDWGLLNTWAVPAGVAIPVAIVLLDLAIYLQHVLFHAVPALWRLHRMHLPRPFSFSRFCSMRHRCSTTQTLEFPRG